MPKKKRRTRLKYLPVDSILPPANPVRNETDFYSLAGLIASVIRFGLLSPLVVRRVKRGVYELVCGSRRLSAAKLAYISEIPCVIVNAEPEECTAMALAENIQRRPLDFLEEADAFQRLSETGITVERASELTGAPEDHITDALRSLNLPRAFLGKIRSRNLTARHALALSKLDGNVFNEALSDVVRFGFDAFATEKYVASLLKASAEQEKSPPVLLLHDARLFLNSVERGVDTMRRSGLSVSYEKDDDENGVILTITLPKDR